MQKMCHKEKQSLHCFIASRVLLFKNEMLTFCQMFTQFTLHFILLSSWCCKSATLKCNQCPKKALSHTRTYKRAEGFLIAIAVIIIKVYKGFY